MKSTKTKVAIIGIGHLGSKHLKVYDQLRDRVEIVGICDPKEERTLKLAQHYQIPFQKDFRYFKNRVDAVNICVPTILHHEIASFFLENGSHTFIEKPITTTLQQADQLISLAQRKNRLIQVGHVERFNAAYESLQHFTEKPLFIECHRMNPFPHRSLDIGVIMDLMIHDIDIVLGLLPSKIKDIQAVGINVLTPFEDIASVRLTFANGCVCNLTASRVSEDVMRKIRIFQPQTYISLDYVKQEAFIYRKDGDRILKHSLPIEKQEPLKKELEHFLDCVENKSRPLVSGEEGRNALKVALDISQIALNQRKKMIPIRTK